YRARAIPCGTSPPPARGARRTGVISTQAQAPRVTALTRVPTEKTDSGLARPQRDLELLARLAGEPSPLRRAAPREEGREVEALRRRERRAAHHAHLVGVIAEAAERHAVHVRRVVAPPLVRLGERRPARRVAVHAPEELRPVDAEELAEQAHLR